MADSLTIDRAGRIVIPAAVRRELALTAGAELEIRVDNGAIVLVPLAGARLARRAGRLVVRSALAGSAVDHRALREERLDRVVGEK